MKSIRLFLLTITLALFFSPGIHAKIPQEIYQEQYNLSGAEKLKEYIPPESSQTLKDIGIKNGDWQELLNLSPQKVFTNIFKIIQNKFSAPLKAFSPLIAIMIICSLVQGVKPGLNNSGITQILNSVCTLSMCVCIVGPIVNFINSSSLIIGLVSNFTLCFVPVMTSILVATGRTLCATSYHTLVIFATEIISYFAKELILPFMSTLLGISLVSSISSDLKLEYLCTYANKVVKSILEFTASVFTSILTLQNLVSSSADSIGANALKLALNGCVPIVGGMVSDALGTVKGCLDLLKSGVGTFGIIAALVMFLPVIIECILWIFFLNLSRCIGNVLELKEISCLVKSVAQVMSVMMAILIFSLVILIVSSGIVLVLGGK